MTVIYNDPTKVRLTHDTWKGIPPAKVYYCTEKQAKTHNVNKLTKFTFLTSPEDNLKLHQRQLWMRSSLFWQGIDKALEEPRKYWDKDFLGRLINLGDIVLILGKVDPRPLKVINCGYTKKIYLEEPETKDRVSCYPQNMVVITDQLEANDIRMNHELDLSEFKNFRNF